MAPIETSGAVRGGRGATFLSYGLPGMAAGAALCWLVGLAAAPDLHAQAGLAAANAPVTALVIDAAGTAGASRLLLIDQRMQAMAVYKIDSLQGGSIKLEAARSFGADLKLSEYNNLPPEVASVEAMVTAPRAGGGPRP